MTAPISTSRPARFAAAGRFLWGVLIVAIVAAWMWSWIEPRRGWSFGIHNEQGWTAWTFDLMFDRGGVEVGWLSGYWAFNGSPGSGAVVRLILLDRSVTEEDWERVEPFKRSIFRHQLLGFAWRPVATAYDFDGRIIVRHGRVTGEMFILRSPALRIPFWIPLALATGLFLRVHHLPGLRLARWRGRRGLCGACRYGLRGLVAPATCPECGAAVVAARP